jgi:hypothetical protein
MLDALGRRNIADSLAALLRFDAVRMKRNRADFDGYLKKKAEASFSIRMIHSKGPFQRGSRGSNQDSHDPPPPRAGRAKACSEIMWFRYGPSGLIKPNATLYL